MPTPHFCLDPQRLSNLISPQLLVRISIQLQPHPTRGLMPLLSKIVQSSNARRWMVLGVLAVLVAPAEAQRHPESSGALPYYRIDPGTPREPPWKQRPPFLRGPQDRYQRGLGRSFLNTEDSVPYLNYADQKYILYFRETIPWAVTSGRAEETRNAHSAGRFPMTKDGRHLARLMKQQVNTHYDGLND